VKVTVPVAVGVPNIAANATGEAYTDGLAEENTVTTGVVTTLRDTDPLAKNADAVIVVVVVPKARVFTAPAFPEELLTTATDGLEEVQTTACRGWVLPSLNVPVASRDCVWPGVREKFEGDTEMDTRVGGV
jgi:hypothetical protein